MRGRGLGGGLWLYRRDRRRVSGSSIRMDGVFAMVPFYEQEEFPFLSRDCVLRERLRTKEILPWSTFRLYPPPNSSTSIAFAFPLRANSFCSGGSAGVIARGLVSDGSLVGYAVARLARWQISSNWTPEPSKVWRGRSRGTGGKQRRSDPPPNRFGIEGAPAQGVLADAERAGVVRDNNRAAEQTSASIAPPSSRFRKAEG